ncbi:MAG: bifunctional phosphoribosylaminoimidazolecarboxamide formyltransferase/IMP cyclohydrolase [Betaproteobacteria bacterium]|jgi:phosphoribosylaminoimidazolecarboxamide formyltransferase/IMP cyclohydrolase|nr:MAG: bifunctional phosphoribosylaminoimidazolecarboxamide formyltransferase/IMP cyclohydrolase [Betaproteobacteria bacterium]
MTTRRIALISVSDKTGLTDLARTLTRFGIEILSTGGTARTLQDAGLEVTEISKYTDFPEMLDGRVKTLHPKVHGGILARRDLDAHLRALEEHNIPAIDIVVVNLYPFVQTVGRPNCTLEDAIENIDIGGPTMVRAAAKNWRHVTVMTCPADYPALIREIEASGGAISQETRFRLAKSAFSHTAAYDSAISNYLTATNMDGDRQPFPAQANMNFVNVQNLRYGENPHQKAAFYRDLVPTPGGIANYAQLQGKELSYNNIADSDAAWECVKTFDQPACVIIKHANPCGVGVDTSVLGAYKKAFSTDTVSAFGGIIAFNRNLDVQAAEAVIEQFVEVIIAPAIDQSAREILGKKQNVRVLEVPLADAANDFDYKRVGGGLLIQLPDVKNVSADELRVVTRKQPDSRQMSDLLFAWRVAKFVKSNAIVFCRNGTTLGVGAGQMSRVDSARIASIKAEKAGLSLTGSIVASDAFFPFRDGVDVVAEAGAKAVIQPGGSVRDEEVIAAADEHEMAMVFTGIRHFRH